MGTESTAEYIVNKKVFLKKGESKDIEVILTKDQIFIFC